MSAIELAQKILKVQELLESVEVKGYTNVSSITQAYEICGEILLEVKKTLEEIQNESLKEGAIDGDN